MDKYPRVGRSHLLYHCPDLVDGRRLTYDFLTIYLLLKNACLLYQRHLVSCILEGDENTVQVQWLLNEIKGALLDTVNSRVDVSVA